MCNLNSAHACRQNYSRPINASARTNSLIRTRNQQLFYLKSPLSVNPISDLRLINTSGHDHADVHQSMLLQQILVVLELGRTNRLFNNQNSNAFRVFSRNPPYPALLNTDQNRTPNNFQCSFRSILYRTLQFHPTQIQRY